MKPPVRILHAHSTFTLGGKEARAVRLMNAFGAAAEHTVLSGMAGALSARDAIDPAIRVHFPIDHPPLVGKPGPGRYRLLARYMRQFDLILSYNWGAMDVVGARRLFGGPPLIHHEDGFNADEVVTQKRARVGYRRLMLPAAYRLVVPSRRLERIALEVWRQPSHRVARISNGIDVDDYTVPPVPSAISGYTRRDGRIVVGTLAGLRRVKHLPRLVRAVAQAGDNIDLVIVGDGPERQAIIAEAAAQGMAHRLFMPGFLPDPARYVGLFDIFALSSDSEQQPISLMEAMAAGLPIVSTHVGDVVEMVGHDNRRFIVAPAAEAGFAEAVGTLSRDSVLRAQLGQANRAKAVADFAAADMIAAYRTLYSAAISRPGALG